LHQIKKEDRGVRRGEGSGEGRTRKVKTYILKEEQITLQKPSVATKKRKGGKEGRERTSRPTVEELIGGSPTL